MLRALTQMQLNEYRTLGRSGLRVSPLCLGTMTFGTEWGWGSEENVVALDLRSLLEAGGNFIDTADGYTGGKSEELVGKFIAERRACATAWCWPRSSRSTPKPAIRTPAATAARTSIARSHGSLRRLQTDYIDLYWLHAWDTVTPVEEVISTLNDLVREGKIRHYGFSDTPAWYVARAQTLAEKEGKERLIALQLEYSLVERNIEREHIPAAPGTRPRHLPLEPAGQRLSDAASTSAKRKSMAVPAMVVSRKRKTPAIPTFKKFNETELEDPRRASRSVARNSAATRPRSL